jgi:hypothetical protein
MRGCQRGKYECSGVAHSQYEEQIEFEAVHMLNAGARQCHCNATISRAQVDPHPHWIAAQSWEWLSGIGLGGGCIRRQHRQSDLQPAAMERFHPAHAGSSISRVRESEISPTIMTS